MLPDDATQPGVFFGGKDYADLCCKLTARVQAPDTSFTIQAARRMLRVASCAGLDQRQN